MGMLNSLHHYFVPALAPATFNVATIVLPCCSRRSCRGRPSADHGHRHRRARRRGRADRRRSGARSTREGFRYRPAVDLAAIPGLRRVLVLMGPGTIGLAATQVNLFVNTLLATGQGTGAASWLTYAFRLMYLPIGLFGVSIATAVLPAAARHAARERSLRPSARRCRAGWG